MPRLPAPGPGQGGARLLNILLAAATGQRGGEKGREREGGKDGRKEREREGKRVRK